MSKRKAKNKHTAGLTKPIALFLFIGLIIILLPVLFSKQTIDPVISIRMLALNIFLLILIVPLVYQFVHRNLDFKFLHLAIFPLFLAYFGLTLLSSFFAINPVEGYFDISKTLLSFVLLIIATGIFTRVRNYHLLITKGFVISTLIAGINGISQYFNISPVETDTELFSTLYQIGGVMGHKNQFALSLFLLLPFCMYGVQKFRSWWLALSIMALIIIFVNIILLQTRSVWVAASVFLGVNFLLYMRFKNDGVSKLSLSLKNPVLLSLMAFLAIGLLIFLLQTKETRSVFAYKINSLLNVDSHDNAGRIGVWNGTLKMIEENPVMGVGSGNWKVHIPEYIVETHDRDYNNWKQPHNDFLWIWSEKGTVALLAYLGMFVLVLVYGWKILRAGNDTMVLDFVQLIFAGILGYVVLASVTFPYDRVNHQVMLMVMFAVIIVEYSALHPTKKTIPKFALSGFFIASTILIFVSLFYNIQSWKSKKNTRIVYEAIEKNNPNAVLKFANLAINPFVSIDEQQAPLIKHRGTAYAMLGKNKLAIDDLLSALHEHPNHISTLNNLAAMYAKNGEFDLAIKYFEKSLALFPKNQQSIKSLARAYFDSGNTEMAYVTLLKYNNHKPDQPVEEFKKMLESELNRQSRAN